MGLFFINPGLLLPKRLFINTFGLMTRSPSTFLAKRFQLAGLSILWLFLSFEGMSQKKPSEIKVSPNLWKEMSKVNPKDKMSFRITVLGKALPENINRPDYNPEYIFST
ncbi:MAG: hypothetical protein ACRC2O_11480, partial [Chitinophagaceae bacterium]